MRFNPHCNKCFSNLEDPSSIFTTCGHFLCPSCAECYPGVETVCKSCGNKCGTIAIHGELPSDISRFIRSNPYEMISQALEILNFQNEHNMLYMRHIQEVNKKKNIEIESLTQKYESEIQVLKSKINSNTSNNRIIQQQSTTATTTPRFFNFNKNDFRRPITPSQSVPIMKTPPSVARTASNTDSNQVFTPTSRIQRSQPQSPSLLNHSTPIRTCYLQRPSINTISKQNANDIQASPVANKRMLFPHNNSNICNNNSNSNNGGLVLKRPRLLSNSRLNTPNSSNQTDYNQNNNNRY